MTAGQTDKTEGNLENVLAHCMTRQGTATTTKCANIFDRVVFVTMSGTDYTLRNKIDRQKGEEERSEEEQ